MISDILWKSTENSYFLHCVQLTEGKGYLWAHVHMLDSCLHLINDNCLIFTLRWQPGNLVVEVMWESLQRCFWENWIGTRRQVGFWKNQLWSPSDVKVKPTLPLIIKIIMTKIMTLAPMIFKLQNQNDPKKDQPNLSVCRGPFPDMCLYSICRQSSSRTWCIHDYCGVIIIIVMIMFLVAHPEPLMVRSW